MHHRPSADYGAPMSAAVSNVPLYASIVTTTGTLIGVTFALWLNGRRDREQWKRDRRNESYLAVLAALDDAYRLRVHGQVFPAVDRGLAALTPVFVYGTGPGMAAAGRAVTAGLALSEAAAAGQEDTDPEHDALGEALGRFRALIREELGLPRLPDESV